MPTERLIIEVRADGTRRATRDVKDVGDAGERAGKSLQTLRNVLLAVGATQVIRQTARLADSYTNLQNRLRLVTNNTAELNQVTDELFAISNRTRTAIDTNAVLFSRLSKASEELGLTNEDLLQVTESLNQAIVISGASSDEANNALRQLAQGLAGGTLRAEEFNSIIEQTPEIANVIAQQLGVTSGALRTLVNQGRVTARSIIEAFQGAREELAERFATTVPTISQSFVVLQNELTRFVGSADSALGISGRLAQTIVLLAGNLERVARFSLGALLIPALIAARAAVIRLTLAAAANPVGALVIGLSVVLGLLVAFQDEIRVSRDGLTSLRDVAVGTRDAIVELFNAAADVVSVFLPELTRVDNGFVSIGEIAQATFVAIGRAIDIVTTPFRTFVFVIVTGFQQGFNLIRGAATGAINFIIRQINRAVQVINRIIEATRDGLVKFAAQASGFVEGAARVVGIDVELNTDGLAAARGIVVGEIEELANESGQIATDALTRAFEQGLEATPIADRFAETFDFFSSRINDARDRRLAGETGPPLPPDAGVGGAGGGPASEEQTALLNRQALALQELNRRTEQSLELGRLTGEAAIRRRAEIATENQLTRQGVQIKTEEAQQAIQAAGNAAVELDLLQRRNQILNEIQTPQQTLAMQQMELNRLLEEGLITQEQYNLALERYIELSERSAQRSEGLAGAFLNVDTSAEKLGENIGNALVGAINQASGALAEFAISGFQNFEQFREQLADILRNLAKQILQIIIQTLILKAIQAGLTGGASAGADAAAGAGSNGAGLLSSIFPPGLQAGGPVRAGEPVVVGEQGPELFVPTGQGNIIPNGQAMAQPQVNVSVVNVSDPNETIEALDSPDGEEKIINIVRRNRRVINQ